VIPSQRLVHLIVTARERGLREGGREGDGLDVRNKKREEGREGGREGGRAIYLSQVLPHGSVDGGILAPYQ